MAATGSTIVHEKPPQRDLSWLISESTPASIAAIVLASVSIFLVLGGTFIVLFAGGITPVDSVIDTLTGSTMKLVLLAAIVGGAVSLAAGLVFLPRMTTKVSREGCIAAAVMGAQAALLGAAVLWFTQGDVETFVRNYMDFDEVTDELDGFFRGMKNTLVLAFGGEFFGIIIGLFVAVLGISKRAVVRAPARAYINFFRGTPLIWQLVFIGIAIPIGLGISIDTYKAGLIAFSLNTGAYAAEVFRAGIQSIERGQLEAARSLGMSYFQAMRYAIVPQAVRRVIPPLLNEFVILIKDTSLIIILGLTFEQRDLMNWGDAGVSNTFNATYLVMTALGYLIITLPLDPHRQRRRKTAT